MLNIPKEKSRLIPFAKDMIDACFNSYQQRASQYRSLRSLFITGTQTGELARFNRLQSHIDYLVSFLFSGETVVFELDHEGKDARHDLMAKEMSRRLKDRWHDNQTDVLLYDACTWSLVYSSMFFKITRTHDYLVDPFDIGVYREDLASIDEQEAIVHRIYITTDEFRRSLMLLVNDGMMSAEEALSAMGRVQTVSVSEDMNVLPPTVSNLIISQVQPNLRGNVLTPGILKGQDVAQAYVDHNNIVRGHEIWVWNDEAFMSRKEKGKREGDWHIITCFEPDIIMISRPNYYLSGENPFVKICPNRVYNYFFGISEITKLLNVHENTQQRLLQISKMLDRQAEPPSRVYGMALPLEMQDALYKPRGVATFAQPNAKFEQEQVKVGEDIWRELDVYGKMFDELSGLPPSLRGYGEKGVRSQTHMSKIASLASSRIKKSALIIEDAIEKVATLRMKLIQKHDSRTMSYLEGEKRVHFTAAQFDEPYTIKVSAHSSSPVFVESLKQEAAELFKAGVIDGEMLVEIFQFPYQNRIRERLKNMEKAKTAEKAEEKQLVVEELAVKKAAVANKE